MAFSKTHVETFQEELTCGICQEKLQNGQFLKCFHSFCEKCLKDKKKEDSGSQRGMIANVATGVFRVATHMFTTADPHPEELKLICPVCSRDGKAAMEDSRQYIFPNIFADMKIDSMDFTDKVREKAEKRETMACESCQENDSKIISFCIDCCEFICGSCVAAHLKLSLTRSHTLIEVDAIRNGKILIDVKRDKANPYCPVHPTCTISQLCTICQVAICSQCRETDLHRLHPCVEITEGLKPFLVEALALTEKISMDTFDEIIIKFVQHKKEIAEVAETLRKQVNQDAQVASAQVLKQVEEKRLAVLAKITQIESDSNRATNDLMKSLQAIRVEADKAASYVSILNSNGTNSDILVARQGGFLDFLRDLGAEMNNKASCRTNATLKLHMRSFPFPRFQMKWYTPVFSE